MTAMKRKLEKAFSVRLCYLVPDFDSFEKLENTDLHYSEKRENLVLFQYMSSLYKCIPYLRLIRYVID